MSEAKDLLGIQQLGELAAVIELATNVVPFPGLAKEKPPPLTDEEIIELRKLIVAARTVSQVCPIARKALEDNPP